MKNILSIAFTGALLAAPALTHAKNDKKPGSSLEGYRFEFPCKGKMPAKPKKGAGCQSALVKETLQDRQLQESRQLRGRNGQKLTRLRCAFAEWSSR